MLHQLIIIHEEKMFINVLKKHCELKDVKVYDIESVNDFQYLIDDISPDIVLIDELIYQKYNDDILRQISQSSNSPKVGVLHSTKNESILENLNYDFVVELPVNPLVIVDELNSKLEVAKK